AEAPRWPDMTHEQRLAHMQSVVMPKMKEVFTGHDATRFASFSCATCHGPEAKDHNFEMPSPHLPALDPSDGFAAHKAADPATTEWMMTSVMPAMVEALGVAPYDPETHQGFGCFGCHQQK